MTDLVTDTALAPDAAPAPSDAPQRPARQGQRNKAGAAGKNAKVPRCMPVLEQLAALYPALFGAVFLPLKRGIFQDLMAAHPEALDSELLKEALALHTRSTRYLSAVASGQQRHDLQAQAVEAMAPEHVHHALLEVHRRRQGRSQEDLRPKLREHMVRAFEASGLSREDYALRVHSRDEAANALLEEALAEAATRAARAEALLRAFESSGQTVEAFADMYGMDVRDATRTLDRARAANANISAPVTATTPAPATESV
jgi:sRNA-binding protein